MFMVNAEQRRVGLLEWLYDRGGHGRFAEFLGIPPRPMIAPPDEYAAWDNKWAQKAVEWSGTLQELQRQGLIDGSQLRSDDFEFTTVAITDRGRNWVEDRRVRQAAEQQERQRRQTDPAERRVAAALGLLRWIDQQKQGASSWINIHPAFSALDFMGDRLSETEIRDAAKGLADDNLIDILDTAGVEPPQVRMTKLGQRRVEPVNEFLGHERSLASMTTNNIFSGQFHNSNVAASSRDFTQTLSSTGDRADEIRALLDAVLQALPVLGLGEADTESVRSNVKVIRGELEKPDQKGEVIKGLLTRVAEGVASGAGSALGSALNLLVKWELARMGVPLE